VPPGRRRSQQTAD